MPPDWEEDFGVHYIDLSRVDVTATLASGHLVVRPEIAASKEFSLADKEFLKQCGIRPEISLDKDENV